ncbi:MAG: hypothetical protein ACWA5R_03540 [bacterium]
MQFYGFEFTVPDQGTITQPRDLYSNPQLSLTTYSSNDVYDLPVSGDCAYFQNIQTFQRIPGLEVKGLTRYTTFKRAVVAASFTAFLLSDQSQKLFSKAQNEGKLTFTQSSKGKASGFLKGLFKSKSSQTTSGGLVDTRARWVTADVVREASATYFASITGSILEDGLSAAPLEGRINSFTDLFLTKVATQTATIPLEEAEFSKMEDDIDFLPSDQEETRKQIIEAINSAKANHTASIKIDNCLEKVIAAAAPKAAAAQKASEIAQGIADKKDTNPQNTEASDNDPPNDDKNKAKTEAKDKPVVASQTTPRDGSTCKSDSSSGAMGGITFKFDGEQKTWIPTSLDVHKIEKKNWEAQVDLSISKIRLDEDEERNLKFHF